MVVFVRVRRSSRAHASSIAARESATRKAMTISFRGSSNSQFEQKHCGRNRASGIGLFGRHCRQQLKLATLREGLSSSSKRVLVELSTPIPTQTLNKSQAADRMQCVVKRRSKCAIPFFSRRVASAFYITSAGFDRGESEWVRNCTFGRASDGLSCLSKWMGVTDGVHFITANK